MSERRWNVASEAYAFVTGLGIGGGAVILIQWFCVIRPLMRRLELKEGASK